MQFSTQPKVELARVFLSSQPWRERFLVFFRNFYPLLDNSAQFGKNLLFILSVHTTKHKFRAPANIAGNRVGDVVELLE